MFQFSQKVISQLSREIQYRIWSTMFTFKCVILPLIYRHMRKIEETTRNFKSDVSAWPWNWQTPSSQFSKATTVKRTMTKSRGRVAMGFSLQWSPQSPEFVSPHSLFSMAFYTGGHELRFHIGVLQFQRSCKRKQNLC